MAGSRNHSSRQRAQGLGTCAAMATEAQLALQQLSRTLSRAPTAESVVLPRAPTQSSSCPTRAWSLASPGRPVSRRAGRQAHNGSKTERRRSALGPKSRVAPSTLRFLKHFAPSIIVTRTHGATEAASMALVGSSDLTLTLTLAITSRPQTNPNPNPNLCLGRKPDRERHRKRRDADLAAGG